MHGSAAEARSDPYEYRRPRPHEREAFHHLQRRGYASGGASLVPRPEAPAEAGAASPVAAPGPSVPDAAAARDDGARAIFAAGLPVAGAYLKRYDTWWGPHGPSIPMESVGGVVALPEARRRGHTARLMAHLVADMRERGVPISTITTPFSYRFYRRSGWEYAFRRLRATFPPGLAAGLGAGARGEARFVRCPAEGDQVPEPLDTVYRRVVRERYQGAAARTAGLWRQRLHGSQTYAYAWDGPAGPCAYAVVEVQRDNVLHVREALALDADGWRGLFTLIAAFATQAERVVWDMPPDTRLDLMVPEQHDLDLRWRPQGMVRLTDVPAAVAARGGGRAAGRLRLRLRDGQAPWNEGPFDVEWDSGHAEARPANGEAPPAECAAMDQRTFAQIYAGAVAPDEAVRLPGVEIGEAAQALLEAAYRTGRAPLLYESH